MKRIISIAATLLLSLISGTAKELPEYWKTELEAAMPQIRALDEQCAASGDGFLFITDTHFEFNNLQSPDILRYLLKHSSARFVVHGGDVISGRGGADAVRRYYSRWNALMKGIPVFYARGNHDNNRFQTKPVEESLGNEELYDLLMAPNGEVTGGRMYYCFDNPEKHIRYFVLDASNEEILDRPYRAQLRWLRKKAGEVDRSWTVVVFQHKFFQCVKVADGPDNPLEPLFGKKLLKTLDRINASRRMPEVAAVISGHTHRDRCTWSETGIACICCTCDTGSGKPVEDWDDANPVREKGTLLEQSLSVVHLDTENKAIYFTRLGAGKDMVYRYGDRSHRLKLLYWNIQNGMWDGQEDDYRRFVDWVKAQDPDICVWCEGQTIYHTGTGDPLPKEDRYLIDNWGELAARYGHSYWGVGGHRDNYPQVITSRYPVSYVDRITGDDSLLVAHGAGWARIEKAGKTFNIVTLHTWPQAYAYRAEDQQASRAEHGGDKYRAKEIEYICEHTIKTVPDAGNQLWMMMGDFNSPSSLDNSTYGFQPDDTRFLVHDYVLRNTPYLDVIHERYPDRFITSTFKEAWRIDMVYCTKPLYDMVTGAGIIDDRYTRPVRDPEGISNFYRPSDHLPVVVEFDLNKR